MSYCQRFKWKYQEYEIRVMVGIIIRIVYPLSFFGGRKTIDMTGVQDFVLSECLSPTIIKQGHIKVI